jgi:hypothetical protein
MLIYELNLYIPFLKVLNLFLEDFPTATENQGISWEECNL